MKQPPFSNRITPPLGFTLIEMLLALAVFALLCGAVYGVLLTTIKTSQDLQQDQNRCATLSALYDFLEHKFCNASVATEVLSLGKNGDEAGEFDGLLIDDGWTYTALTSVRQRNGLEQLRVLQFDRSEPGSSNQSLLEQAATHHPWIPLVNNLALLSCRFHQVESPDSWLNQWTDSDHRPALVEITLRGVEAAEPTVMDFILPTLILPLTAQVYPNPNRP